MKKQRRFLSLVLVLTLLVSIIGYSPFNTLATEAISLDEYERENYLKPDSLPMDAEPTIIAPQDVPFTEGASGKHSLDGDDWKMAEGGTVEERVGVDETKLLGHWRFDEGSGTKLVDSTGNYSDLTSTAVYVEGLDGTALSFNGSSQNATGNAHLNLDTELTVSVFIKAASTVEKWRVFLASKSKSEAGHFELYFNGSKYVEFYAPNLSQQTINSGKALNDDKWHHIAVTLSNGVLTMYVDGAAVKSVSGVTGTLSGTDNKIYFGSLGNSMYYKGLLDDARIYGRALSAAEIGMLSTLKTEAEWSDGIDASVPASVHTNLLNAGLLQDPYDSLNDAAAQAESLKTWWMKKNFTYSGDGKNVRLNFEGICDRADIWLNGVCIGSHQGMFGGPYIDVTKYIRQGENSLVIRLHPAVSYKNTVVFNCTNGWHYAKIWPLGIWNSVSIEDVPEVEIKDPFIATKDIVNGTMDFTAELVSSAAFSGTLKLKVTPKNFSGSEAVYAYEINSSNATASARLQFDIPDPQLWWPNGSGEQNLYWLALSFEDENGNVVDFAKTSFGIRTIEMGPTPSGESETAYNWTFIVNNKEIFMKGTGWCTTDALMRFTEESYDTQLSRAKAQGVNFLRAWGGGMPETDTFYDLCDKYGLLVYQEWPIHDESYDTQPADVLYETVILNTRRLRNRPSLIMWGGGNECDAELENEVLNNIGRLTLENDGTRPWHRQDPYGDGSSHNYNTYWGGQPLDRYLNVYDTFLSEFGLASMPNVESILKYSSEEELNTWPITENSSIWHHTPLFGKCSSSYAKGDIAMMSYFADEFIELDSVESLVLGTQLAQSVGIRHTLENTRTLWPNSTGIAYYKMNDVYPAASWSTVDWYGSPKMSYYFLQDAYQSLAAVGIVKKLNQYGSEVSIPIWILDDNDELSGSNWKVSARAYNGGLELVKEVNFTGSGSIDRTRELGKLTLTAEQTETAPLFIVTDVVKDGTLSARNYFFLNYEAAIGSLFALPVTELSYTQNGNTVTVINNGDKPAVAANLTFADSTVVTPSDNFVWLEAGESQVITLEGVGGVDITSAVTGFTAWNAKDEEDTIAPSGPSGVTATDISNEYITLTWNTVEDATSYHIYRDEVKVGIVNGKSSTFTDRKLYASTAYSYKVVAEDQGGNLGASATVEFSTTAEIYPPQLNKVTMTNESTIVLEFDEPLDEASAETVENYSLTGGVKVTNATLGDDYKTVILTITGADFYDYTLTVTGVCDRSGNEIEKTSKLTAKGLVGYWAFDEGSGTKLVDSTDNHEDLTISNATYVDGKGDTAVSFTGVSTSYAAGNTNVGLGNEFTVSVFVKADSTVANWKVFMAKGDTEVGDFQLYFHSKKVRFYANGLLATDLQSNKVIADGTWHHVALTLKNGTLTMYIDGIADVSVSGLTGSLVNVSRPLYFGKMGKGSYCACSLDDARIYNYALDAKAVMSLNNMQVVKGDANGDKVVDICDLVKANNYLKNGAATDVGAGADANSDGVINEADLTTIRKLILGIV